MARLSNFMADKNRFQLAGPPQWFLCKLWDFDPSLVIVPSRQGFYYRLAQRRRPQLAVNIVNDVLKEQADTQMLSSYNLVPVTTIIATVNWNNPLLFVELANRAPWRLGGAAKVNKMIEDQEKAERQAKQQHQDEHLSYLGRDAWNLYKMKQGLRSHMWSPGNSPLIVPDPNKKVPAATVYPAVFSR